MKAPRRRCIVADAALEVSCAAGVAVMGVGSEDVVANGKSEGVESDYMRLCKIRSGDRIGNAAGDAR